MDNNYYTSPDLLNAINNANYLYTKMTNTSPQEVKKTINDNDEIGEVPPKDEDFDHLQKFAMDNKINYTKKSTSFSIHSFFSPKK